VSTTVAVQVEAWLIGTEAGLQVTVVEVVRRVPVTDPLPVPLLVEAAWVVLPPYAPVIVASPAALGVNVTEHVEVPTVALATRVHGFGVPKVPATPVSVNVTEPEGLLAPAPLVSTTVAVHVEA
jgi:hypothetical protein